MLIRRLLRQCYQLKVVAVVRTLGIKSRCCVLATTNCEYQGCYVYYPVGGPSESASMLVPTLQILRLEGWVYNGC